MANNLDSTSLFLSQMNQHAEILSSLLGSGVGDRIDEQVLERAIVGTTMLSKSATLMDLPEWGSSLQAFELLLHRYRENGYAWDERIAQVTSEIIEKEDTFAACAGDGNLGGVTEEELVALSREVGEILDHGGNAVAADPDATGGTSAAVVEEAPDVDAPGDGTPGAEAPTVDAPVEEIPDVAPVADAPDDETSDVDVPSEETPVVDEAVEEALPVGPDEPATTHMTPQTLDSCMSELRRHTELLLDGWDSPKSSGHAAPPALGETRKTLALINFYAVALKRIIDVTNRCEEPAMIESLTPIRLAIEDGARAYCDGNDRRFELVFDGENNSIDARLLGRVQVVLQHLIGDIFLRSNGANLRIELTVEKKNGVLFWSLGDDGDNFITDSRLDRDEYLAFYPGLRKVRRELEDLQSLLWVEPDGSGKNRFAFTTPVSLGGERFMMWGTDGDCVTVFASQIAGVYTLDEVEVIDDSRGENITVDGRRIRVLRLGQLLAGGPEDGDKVIVIGSLETRIAFFVSGEGTLVDGVWKKEAVPTWRGMENGVVQIGDKRVPLIDANELLRRYMAIVDAVAEEDVSGGVDTEVSDPSHAQAHMELDAQTPPEPLNKDDVEEEATKEAAAGGVDVLVVEQSNTLRTALESILSEKTINTIVVTDLDDARAVLKDDSPKLIISDFRVPSMSAKALVDELGHDGKKIPVLVTTTHRGDNADILVERLGVAGYICKPLERDDVWERVGAFLERSDTGVSGV